MVGTVFTSEAERLRHARRSMAAVGGDQGECPKSGGGCPVNADGGVNPLNNELEHPNQKPAPDQPFPLPLKREKSTIPKAFFNTPFSECAEPKLKSFKGDAKNISPRARFRNLFLGYNLPFDRHDWIVDRCGVKEVQYVIDYYDGGSVDPRSKLFTILDVRPALNDFGNIWDRMVVAYWRFKFDVLGMTPKLPIPPTEDDVHA
ncbi:cytochrome c/c1 heme lyase [Cooperia oncophora]